MRNLANKFRLGLLGCLVVGGIYTCNTLSDSVDQLNSKPSKLELAEGMINNAK